MYADTTFSDYQLPWSTSRQFLNEAQIVFAIPGLNFYPTHPLTYTTIIFHIFHKLLLAQPIYQSSWYLVSELQERQHAH